MANNIQGKKELEYTAMPEFRASSNAISKVVIFFGIGIFLFIIFNGILSPSTYEQKFIDDFLGLTVGDNDLKTTIEEPIILTIVESQRQTITMVRKLPGFSKLGTKTDGDTLAFVAGFDALETTINSDQYIDLIKEQYSKQTKGLDIGESILDQIPLISKTAKYAWILYAISTFVMIIFIGNLIIANLSGLIYYLLQLIIHPQETVTEQNQNA